MIVTGSWWWFDLRMIRLEAGGLERFLPSPIRARRQISSTRLVIFKLEALFEPA
jgi:hypothetical protein